MFSTDKFKKWAKEKVVLVHVDSPRSKQLPAELQKQNDELKRKYQIRGFPTILFIDANEGQIGRHGYGKGGPDPWIAKAEQLLK